MEQELRQMFEMKETEMDVPRTLSPELRSRIGRQRMIIGGLVAAAAVAVVLGGFAGARSLSSDEALPPVNPDVQERDSSGGMWPQSNQEEAQRAQGLADEGNPDYTWQVWPNVFPRGAGEMDPRAVEFFTRFFQEKLGWEEFRWGVAPGLYAGVSNDWPWEFVAVRCAPGETNPLYPNDPEGKGCAPTIDGHAYETVKVNADQPTRHWEDPDGPDGIWVVTRWAMVQPADAPFTDTHDFFERQAQQIVPPSESEATALLEDFLQARVDGDGAEEYLHTPTDAPIPLLYATTSDTPYERSEFELVQGPVWPGGWMEFEVRLFSKDGTVVEQPVLVEPGENGRLGLEYGTLEDEEFPTTENGENLSEPYKILGSEVTFGVPPPWYGFFDYGPNTIALDSGDTREANFSVLADPLPVEGGCKQGPAPADAEELVRSIRSDPDLEATKPVTASVGRIDAVWMDVTAAAGASVCDDMGTALVVSGPQLRGPALKQGNRMRLYLLDLPEGSSARTLAIAFVAPEAGFESVLEEAPPILDSFEFDTP
ncbi:MAG: hypothetical protein QOH26_454 [Actinomycetota bacterium]|jgi:hypothetical protein|nr:hypothetical protein [Actinomycetota bacterium]